MKAIPAREVYVSASPPRRAVRTPSSFSLTALDRLFRKEKIRLVNVSAGGFEATGGNHKPGDVLWIDLPGLGFVRSQVRWRDTDRFGAAFLDSENLRLKFINGLPRAAND